MKFLANLQIEGMLGLLHIMFLVMTIFLLVAVHIKSKDLSKKKAEKILKFFAIIMLFYDPVFWIREIVLTGTINLKLSLPLYLCSLFWMVLPIAAFSKNKFARRTALAYLCSANIIAALCGLIFNTHLNNFGLFEFVPFSSLLYHVIMIAVPVILRSSGYYKARRSDLKLFFIPYTILFAVCIVFGKLFGWDYCYVRGGIDTPFELFSSLMPLWLFVTGVYLLFGFTTVVVFYLKVLKRPKMSIEEIPVPIVVGGDS